ncbi:mitochondrial transcription rescue factor 1 isoform X1 [Entelurus aequoreus]|uniref:mitochondrial transcription rescue factor 1 isoform X1 n=2 Tax=Entelurus aequoreus TaxID=161455 RepID=UPI002B1E56E2|nr:mitochondrial transcription rescue factor 1 isoform X1 [Entelurus aequoreus]
MTAAGEERLRHSHYQSSSMHSLLVQALAMRQLGRLNPRHLLAAGYGPAQTEWCPRTIHTRQLWGCSTYSALGCTRTALCSRDAVRRWTVHQLRFKSNKKKGAAKPIQEEEEEEEDEEQNPESDYEDEVEEDPNILKDYKDIEKYVESLRYDAILRAGLDVAHNKIEDSFYSNNLRLNGQPLIKKSKTVKVGDTLDMVLSENSGAKTVTLKRVILKKFLGKSNNAEKHKISLRRWKFIELPQDEAFKPRSPV